MLTVPDTSMSPLGEQDRQPRTDLQRSCVSGWTVDTTIDAEPLSRPRALIEHRYRKPYE